MAGASEQSQALILEEFEPTLAAADLKLGEELFAVLDLLDENPGLRRALTDPSRDDAEKEKLVETILGNKVSAEALNIVSALARARWSNVRDFGDALEKVAATAVAATAEKNGREGLEKLENDLFAFQNVVASDHGLQAALTEPQASGDAKGTLALKLVPGASEEAKVLIQQAVRHPRGYKPQSLIREFQDIVAGRQRRYIAEVYVSRPLSDDQVSRLQNGLNKLYQRELNLNVHVDPSLIGGIRVQVGDEVVDATVMNRLNELGRKLAG
ncbi:F0F1 ATP synthase subunit delta [Haematomicrobium sanguinis]|uniref:F0F1 ATP synthase subunit delta n=1 Tax=Haematomicrobium sanguinis TaxID=479106 RepID=UPI00047D5B8E|nr:F0F1 ATP synthase subunit delta [Haematomicrobium sanguinis]